MSETMNKEPTEKEKEEIRKIVDETDVIYNFIEDNSLRRKWMGDSERFMGFSFFHTRELVKHSIALTKLTRWLEWLTFGLFLMTLIQILIHFKLI